MVRSCDTSGCLLCTQAGGFKLPFIVVGGAVLVFVPVTYLLIGNTSKYSNSLIPRPHVQRKV